MAPAENQRTGGNRRRQTAPIKREETLKLFARYLAGAACAAVVVGIQNYFSGVGAWVTVIEGAIFVLSVMLFREGIVGILARWLKKSL